MIENMARALAGISSLAGRAAHAAQWGGGGYRDTAGVIAAVCGIRLAAVTDPWWPTNHNAHMAWRGPDPRFGPGCGHLYVMPVVPFHPSSK